MLLRRGTQRPVALFACTRGVLGEGFKTGTQSPFVQIVSRSEEHVMNDHQKMMARICQAQTDKAAKIHELLCKSSEPQLKIETVKSNKPKSNQYV